jgi:hypothetical protein
VAGVKGRSGSGGPRPNSGPKPKAVKYKRQIAKATDVMGRMLPEAADAVADLARGAYVILIHDPQTKQWIKPSSQKMVNTAIDMGVYRIYQELPDVRAIQIVFERLMGKVPQPVDITMREAISDVTESQAILMRVIEEHVPDEYLAPIRAELERVADLHSRARTAIGVEAD